MERFKENEKSEMLEESTEIKEAEEETKDTIDSSQDDIETVSVNQLRSELLIRGLRLLTAAVLTGVLLGVKNGAFADLGALSTLITGPLAMKFASGLKHYINFHIYKKRSNNPNYSVKDYADELKAIAEKENRGMKL